MFFYIEEDGNKFEVKFDPNLRGESSYDIVHIATIMVHTAGYRERLIRTIEQRWNLLISNHEKEVEGINPATGMSEYCLVPKT